MLASLRQMTAGTYDFSEVQDDGVMHKLRLIITAEKFSVYLRGNPKQSGSKNSSGEGWEIALQLAFKDFTDPDGPGNGGWGAWEGNDSTSCRFYSFHGDTFNCPADIAEARYGKFVDQVALNAEPGGRTGWAI